MGRIVMSVVMMVVLLMGGGALSGGIKLLLAGDPNRAGAITAVVMGLVLVGLALAYFYWVVVLGPVEDARLARVRQRYPGQPWMERKDWASGVLSSSNLTTAIFSWFWTVAWFSVFGFIATVNRDKILNSPEPLWWKVLIGGVFLGAGLLGLYLAIAFSRHAFRYGTSTFRLETLPAYMGERLAGRLSARFVPLPRQPIEVELVCEDVEWVRSGYGKDRQERRVVRRLGSRSTTADPARFMVSKGEATGRIEIEVPTGLPVSFTDRRGNGIRWWLRISTHDADTPFSCEFEVPVYERGKVA